MSGIKIRPEQFEQTVRKLLAEYGDDAIEIMANATKNASRKTVADLKSQSPVGKEGKYARGWSHKAQKSGITKYTEIVYNRTDYQLTHLLEKPHATGGGGHYPSKKDHTGIIARIEEENVNRYIEEVSSKL